ncbi:hypothetical protein ABZ934_02115 [Streptomyces sp. NPDC046557]|uniref:hypothetical protein n=1 Tax=Streptomyces sp. NPDC046557 TaxID=3155372 RepID=UPI0033CD9025
MPQAPAGSGPRRRAVLAAALAPLAVAGCTTESARPAPGPKARPEDALVMIIRHGEQPPPGDTGEDDDGNEHPGSLAGRGERRAEELPRLFPPAARAPLPRPAVIFATGGGPSAPARSKQTVGPLATALRLPVRAEFAIGAEPALAQAVLAARMPVLVCWEHPGIPRLVRALGAHHVLGVPAAWPDRHDLVWMFTRHQGRWDFRELPQHLLAGDA